MADTYTVYRFYQDPEKNKEIIAEDLTREEAVEHCEDPDTSGDGWFDGFEKD